MDARRGRDEVGAPTPPGSRHEIVDVVRGFALFGVFVANMVVMSRLFALTDAQRAALPTAGLDAVVAILVLVFVQGKFITIFSLLFGVGFTMQLGSGRRPEAEVVRTYLRRLVILLLIGVAHAILVWFGDILHIYAVAGVALIAFRHRSDRTLLAWAAGLALLEASLPLLQWAIVDGAPGPSPAADPADAPDLRLAMVQARFTTLTQGSWTDIVRFNWTLNRDDYASPYIGYGSMAYWYLGALWKFLLGVVAGRRMLLQRADAHLSTYRRALAPLLVVGLVGNGIAGLTIVYRDAWLPDIPSLWATLAWIPIDLSMLALSLAYVLGVVLLYEHPRARAGLRLLAPVGRMALTSYLSQSVAMVLLLYGVGLGLLGKVGTTACVGLCLVIYALQVALSAWWLTRVSFGPAEWVWRSLTYGRFQPMRVDGAAATPSR
ncbi:MAG: DUF418 domain-containing protein [Dehalococcoidia bacterium]